MNQLEDRTVAWVRKESCVYITVRAFLVSLTGDGGWHPPPSCKFTSIYMSVRAIAQHVNYCEE